MMTFIIKPGILWLLICSWYLQLNAQNLEETIEFADNQFNKANYQLAVKEYQRALYFSQGEKADYLYRQIAHAFFANNQFEQANYFYELSYKTAKVDSVKYELLFSKTQCYLLSGDFKQSLVELLNLPDSLSEYFNNKRNFYLAIIYFGTEDFKLSEKHFLNLIDEKDLVEREKISKLFSKKKNLFRPNPKTAKTLSTILPGAGQMYAGDVKNSLNSLLLTGGFVALGIVMIEDYTVLDAILTSLPWFMRYHQGGYNKAYYIAFKKRATRRNKVYKEILDIIKQSKNIN